MHSAQVIHPNGGQGLNSGIQDAVSSPSCFHSIDLSNIDTSSSIWGGSQPQVAKDISPAGLLQTYNEERLPVIPKMLDLVADLNNKPSRSPQLGMLGIHYRWSSYFRLGSDDELNNPAYTDNATNFSSQEIVPQTHQILSLVQTK
jgi:2-polyprenyl-6-methoxyphenol hydroxylase-like FAD-dependent oxidoreductase